MKVLLRALGASVALLAVLYLPAAASAATGSYTVNAWRQSSLTHARMWVDGATITPPAGIPAGATVTSVTAFVNFYQTPPWNQDYEARLCDYNTMGCVMFPVDSQGMAGWATTSTAYAGKPAATWKFFIGTRLNDGGGGSIYPALNPWKDPHPSRYVTVNYEYTPAP